MSQRNRNIILWVIAIGLLVSMVISFTPGNLFGNSQQEAAEGPVALTVNGEEIRELEIQRLEQNPPFNAVQEGPAAEDLQLVLLDQLVSQTVLQQAAADVDVSSGEVRDRVNEFREQQGVAGGQNDRAYQNLLAGAGYTDGTFRDLTRQQLQQEKYLDNLTTGEAPTDAEIQTYYAANQSNYQSEPRITAREIVVADEDEADALYAQALAGADFAALARENSAERAEQGGALGAAEGESTPQPITRVALPTAVAQAAFALQGPGLTAPVEAGGVYHIVKVEEYTPAGTRPLDEVRSEVETDLSDLREAAAEERALRTLKASAEITSPAGSSYRYENPVVARVGSAEISEVELDRNTYLNPQVQQLLNPNFAEIIANSVKPNVLTQLIDDQLAVQGARTLDGSFTGPDSAVAQSALGYVSRNVTANDQQVRSFYEENQANYTEQPSALTTRVNFSDAASARAFRQALTNAETINAESIGIAADAARGSAEELGDVAPGSQPEEIGTVLFDFEQGMTALGESGFDISRVLTLDVPAEGASGGAASGGAASGGATTATQEQFVVLVAARTPERVRPLNEVRAQVRQAALQQRQNERQQEWLDGLREEFPVENLLVSASAPTGAQSGGATSGGVESGGTAGNAPDAGTPDGGPILTPTPVPEPQSDGARDEGAQDGETQGNTPNPDQTEATQGGGDQNEAAQDESVQEGDAETTQPATQPGDQSGNGQESDSQESDGQNSNSQNGSAQNRPAQGQSGAVQGRPVQGNAAPDEADQNQDPQGAAEGGSESNAGGNTQQNNAQGQGTQDQSTRGQGTQGGEAQGVQNNDTQSQDSETAPQPEPVPAPQGGNTN